MSDSIYSSLRRRLLEVLEVRVALQRRAAALVDRPYNEGLTTATVSRREHALRRCRVHPKVRLDVPFPETEVTLPCAQRGPNLY